MFLYLCPCPSLYLKIARYSRPLIIRTPLVTKSIQAIWITVVVDVFNGKMKFYLMLTTNAIDLVVWIIIEGSDNRGSTVLPN